MQLARLLKITPVRAFLSNGDVFLALETLCTMHGLPAERAEELLDLCDAVLDGQLTIDQMPGLIAQAFGVPDTEAKVIAADVVGARLLPLANFVPGIEEGIVALGGDVAKYPATRVPKDYNVYLVLLKEITDRLQINFSDVLLKRLLFLLEQFVKQGKNEANLKEFLKRSVNIGGLGLTEDQATSLLVAVIPEADMFAHAHDEPVKDIATPAVEAAIAAPQVEPIAIPDSPTSVAPAVDVSEAVTSEFPDEIVTEERGLEISPSHELVSEVPVINAPKQVVKAPVPADEPIDPNELKAPARKAAVLKKSELATQDNLTTALALATAHAAGVLKKAKISERVFTDVATKTLKGLRDMYQTRDTVEREFGLKGEDLAVFIEAIAVGVEAYQSQAKAMAAAAPAAPVSDSQSPREAAILAQRFAQITDSHTGELMDPAMPGARVSAARSLTDDLQIQEQKLATAAEVAPKSPPKAKAELTVGSARLETTDGQRKMVDVVGVRRLMGPIEQIGTMTPLEFRRLSSDPAEAVQKIQDLLTALQENLYEDRVRGIAAWRESPINQLYLQITEAALEQGLGLPEVSSKRRAAGQESLSPAEMKALAQLNAKIRF